MDKAMGRGIEIMGWGMRRRPIRAAMEAKRDLQPGVRAQLPANATCRPLCTGPFPSPQLPAAWNMDSAIQTEHPEISFLSRFPGDYVWAKF